MQSFIKKCCEIFSKKRVYCLSLVNVSRLENDFVSDATIDFKTSTTFNYLNDCYMKVKNKAKVVFEVIKIAKVEKQKKNNKFFFMFENVIHHCM